MALINRHKSLTGETSREPRPPKDFTEYAQRTLPFPLHAWQEHGLCPLIESFCGRKGVRALMHKPPQTGGSILVSQRLPGYLIGRDPTTRIGLACYNETHAEGFGFVVRSILNSHEHLEMFPNATVPIDSPVGKFSTHQRRSVMDAQPSFLAMGLNSGFTGRGVDWLIIDDPYKSSDDAASLVINEKVWRFWIGTAEPRIGPETNVLVMFHRYHDDDFAGRLYETGKFEMHRFPMEADGLPDDRSGLSVGSILSPLRTPDWVAEIKAGDAERWRGQFQGRPYSEEGALIRPNTFNIVKEHEVPDIRCWFRGYDFSLEAGKRNDWFAETLIGVADKGRVYQRVPVWEKLEITDARDRVLANTRTDPKGTVVCLPKSAVDLTVFKDLRRHPDMRGYPIWGVDLKGRNKWQMSSGWVSRAHSGLWHVIEDPRWPDYRACLSRFKNLAVDFDDPIDATSAAFDGAYPLIDGLEKSDKPLPPWSRELWDKMTDRNETWNED